jgi:hypothetical protein
MSLTDIAKKLFEEYYELRKQMLEKEAEWNAVMRQLEGEDEHE